MNPIQALHEHVRHAYPNATVDLGEPVSERGFWSLDVDLGDQQLAIQWDPATGFGVTSINHDTFGEGPDETFSSLNDVKQRVDRLLSTNEKTSPPFPVLLSRLRERRGLTQQDLAARLGVRQSTISGLERRDDVQLSTLRRLVEALGGGLEVWGVFPDSRYRIEVSSSESRHGRVVARSPEVQRIAPSRESGVVFTILSESGSLARAQQTAAAVRFRGAVLEMG